MVAGGAAGSGSTGNGGAGNSVAEILLRLAWRQLWKPGTPYYLPAAVASGASGNGVVVPRLAERPVPDLGPYNLFSADPWGDVSIALRENVLDGLPTIADGGFSYDDDTRAYAAKVTFGALEFSGQYFLAGDGLAGCALASISGLLHEIPTLAAARSGETPLPGDEPQPPEQVQIALAQDYRSRLVRSEAGLDLVARYYDNNEAMNEIASGQNVFTANFTTVTTTADGERVNSVDLANRTTAAAKNPSDPDETVGDTAYRAHSYTMQILFARACETAYRSTHDTKYTNAGDASTDFATLVINRGPAAAVTADQVMDSVHAADRDDPTWALLRRRPGDAPADYAELGLRPPQEASEEYRLAMEAAQQIIDEWEASGRESLFSWEVAERAAGTDGVPIGYGTFSDHISGPSLTVNGSVNYTGTPTSLTLTISVDSITADLPEIDIQLAGNPGTLYDRVVGALAQATFVKELLRKKLQAVVSDQSVRTYLQDRVNQSISQALGSY
jgi:hypothetical protein